MVKPEKILLVLAMVFVAMMPPLFAQIYKAELICIKENEKFIIVGQLAYMNYNINDKEVDLAFRDTLYHYQILQTGKPKDRQRFVVWFKKTKDNMLWNISEEGDYIFAFKIGQETFWFRELSNVEKDEFDNFVKDFPKKSYN